MNAESISILLDLHSRHKYASNLSPPDNECFPDSRVQNNQPPDLFQHPINSIKIAHDRPIRDLVFPLDGNPTLHLTSYKGDHLSACIDIRIKKCEINSLNARTRTRINSFENETLFQPFYANEHRCWAG